MNQTQLHERILENKDWAALVFVLCMLFVALTKSAFENKFSDFKNLIISEKYIKTYRDSSHLMTWFTFLLFIVQILTFSFFIMLTAIAPEPVPTSRIFNGVPTL